ncbi:hypothetical protein N7495_005266 [Penicillium taxi]|uniref:uncharacterized protein n=1 Tax=Penicillium taxi TaxID=168475 RepID=UPI0025456CBE|nr:uncharacterized protein N7495_005266 [Penicillium taxi]KAJ5893575.1 hypothetical protein N7495_005266 [Penicillium taxi]
MESPKPRTKKDYRKLKEAVFNFRDNKISKSQLTAVAENSAPIDNDTPTLPISSLRLHEVEPLFGLKFTKENDELRNQPSLALTEPYVTMIDHIQRAFSSSKTNKTVMRFTLNYLLVFAYNYTTSHSNQKNLQLQVETQWSYGPVTFEGVRYNMGGKPAYCLCYGQKEDVAVGVVIVEVKQAESASSGLAQTLAYMGCVHQYRKKAGKVDTTVYGIATDTTNFIFLKINNNSEWSQHWVTARLNDFEQVVGILVFFFREASMMSPSHSKRPALPDKSYSCGSSGLSRIEIRQ